MKLGSSIVWNLTTGEEQRTIWEGEVGGGALKYLPLSVSFNIKLCEDMTHIYKWKDSSKAFDRIWGLNYQNSMGICSEIQKALAVFHKISTIT